MTTEQTTTTVNGLGGIKVQVPLVIEMTGEQVAAYAEEYGLPKEGGPLRARHIVEDVRAYVLTCVQDSAAFGEIGLGDGTRAADVSIKGR